MLHRFNKKFLFHMSLMVSSVLSLVFGATRDTTQAYGGALDIPIGSIEKAYAEGAGGDCSGSSGSSGDGSAPTSAGVDVEWAALGANDWSNNGSTGDGGSDGGSDGGDG